MSSVNQSVLYYEELVNKAGVLALVDQDGRYIYVSESWQKKTGLRESDVIGEKVISVLNGSSADEAMRRNRTVSGVMYYKTAQGKTFEGYVKYIPVKSKDQTKTGCLVVSVFEDDNEAGAFAAGLSTLAGKKKVLRENAAGNNAKYTVDSILGKSASIQELKRQIRIAAGIRASCLIEGETGTGKELVAHAIHNHSTRSAFPFVRVNCSAIPETLIESEFFGYEEGSFTGSVKGGRAGKFENAHQGSIFLDEINAMHLTMQPKLLRVLQEREVERIGGSRTIPVDVRVIAASNKPLADLIRSESFREDLYFRLNIINIMIPPLRERPEDIAILAESFIERYNEDFQQNVKGLDPEALELLASYSWPGNVRELQNAIERAMAYGSGEGKLQVEDFERFGGFRENRFAAVSDKKMSENLDDTNVIAVHASDHTLNSVKEGSERRAVLDALKQSGGNKSKAAQILGISRTMLYNKLKKYGI